MLKNQRLKYDRTDNFLQSHITIFNFQINSNHPNSNIFETSEFRNLIRYAFDNFLSGENIIHTRNDYKILSKFYGKEYTLKNSNKITEFRMCIYNYIQSKINRYTIYSKNGFKYLRANGQDLIAINDFNWRKGQWLIHNSILQFRNDSFKSLSLYHCNRSLYNIIHNDYQNKNNSVVKQQFNRCITTYQTNILKNLNEVNIMGNLRSKVIPFRDLTFNNHVPLMISMNRNNPNQNWNV